MSEKQFQATLIRKLKENRYSVFHVNNIAGFPDLLLLKEDRSILIELKEMKGNQKIKNLFTKQQPSFYLNYLSNNAKLFLLIKNKNMYCIRRITKYFIKNLDDNIYYDDLVKNIGNLNYLITNNLDLIIRFIEDWGKFPYV